MIPRPGQIKLKAGPIVEAMVKRVANINLTLKSRMLEQE
jgi:hypothetical protein